MNGLEGGVIGAIITSLSGVVLWFLNRPKHKAEAHQMEAEAKATEATAYLRMLEILERMSTQIEKRDGEIQGLKTRQDELEKLIEKKDFQIKTLETTFQSAIEERDKEIAKLRTLLEAERTENLKTIQKLEAKIAELQEARRVDAEKFETERANLQKEMAVIRDEQERTQPIPTVEPSNVNPLLVLTAPESAIRSDGEKPSE